MRRSAGRVPREYFGGVLPHFWCGKTPGSRPGYFLAKYRHVLRHQIWILVPRACWGFGLCEWWRWGQIVQQSSTKDAQYQYQSMTKNLPLWHIWIKFRQTCPKLPRILKANLVCFGGKRMIWNPKMEKRPRNFYGANVATLGIFQTESILVGFTKFRVYNRFQHTATHCNTLQHNATQCNTLQHTATHCNTLQHNGLQ